MRSAMNLFDQGRAVTRHPAKNEKRSAYLISIQQTKDFFCALLDSQLAIHPGLSGNDFFKCRDLKIILHINRKNVWNLFGNRWSDHETYPCFNRRRCRVVVGGFTARDENSGLPRRHSPQSKPRQTPSQAAFFKQHSFRGGHFHQETTGGTGRCARGRELPQRRLHTSRSPESCTGSNWDEIGNGFRGWG